MTVKCPEFITSSTPFLLKENTVQSTCVSTPKDWPWKIKLISMNVCFLKVSSTSENVYDPLIWQFLQTQHKWHSKGGGKQWEGSDLGAGKKEVHCGEFKVIIKVENKLVFCYHHAPATLSDATCLTLAHFAAPSLLLTWCVTARNG